MKAPYTLLMLTALTTFNPLFGSDAFERMQASQDAFMREAFKQAGISHPHSGFTSQLVLAGSMHPSFPQSHASKNSFTQLSTSSSSSPSGLTPQMDRGDNKKNCCCCDCICIRMLSQACGMLCCSCCDNK